MGLRDQNNGKKIGINGSRIYHVTTLLCALMARPHSSKNSSMTQLLASSTALHQIYTLAVPCQLSQAERVQRKTKVKDLLCKIFECKRNRLQCMMKNIGQLAQLLPKLLCVQLVTGHSLFWDELRKVARAVNSQPNQQSKLAAIVAIRRKLPSASPCTKDLAPNVQAKNFLFQCISSVFLNTSGG